MNAQDRNTRTVANREQRSTSVPSYVPVGDGNARTVETDADLERHRSELNIANTSTALRGKVISTLNGNHSGG